MDAADVCGLVILVLAVLIGLVMIATKFGRSLLKVQYTVVPVAITIFSCILFSIMGFREMFGNTAVERLSEFEQSADDIVSAPVVLTTYIGEAIDSFWLPARGAFDNFFELYPQYFGYLLFSFGLAFAITGFLVLRMLWRLIFGRRRPRPQPAPRPEPRPDQLTPGPPTPEQLPAQVEDNTIDGEFVVIVGEEENVRPEVYYLEPPDNGEE